MTFDHIKSQKKTGFHLFSEKYIFGKKHRGGSQTDSSPAFLGLKHLWKKKKKMGKTYTRWWILGWGIAEVSLPLRKSKQKMQREITRGKCLENSWAFLNSIFMNDNGLIHTLKGRKVFFTTFAEKFIIQITGNVILYTWHLLPGISHGKLLVLLFFLFNISAPTSFSFFFWYAPDDSLRENSDTLTAPLYLMNLF